MKKNRKKPRPFIAQGLCYRFVLPVSDGFILSTQKGLRKRMTFQEIQDLQNS